jgi:hypothetical protein
VKRPFPLVPGTRLNRVTKPPEPGLAFVGSGTNERPAFACWQLDDAVNMRSVDMISLAGNAVHKLAVPAPAGIQMEHFVNIAARKDFGLEPLGMVVRCGVRLLDLGPVQRFRRQAIG